jgi:predicted MFS family arabinose efflux permease
MEVINNPIVAAGLGIAFLGFLGVFGGYFVVAEIFSRVSHDRAITGSVFLLAFGIIIMVIGWVVTYHL